MYVSLLSAVQSRRSVTAYRGVVTCCRVAIVPRTAPLSKAYCARCDFWEYKLKVFNLWDPELPPSHSSLLNEVEAR